MYIATIQRIARIMEAACLSVGALCLLYMVGVVGINVLARILFDATDTAVNLMIPGAIEQVSYLLGIIALAALSTSMAQGLMAVDVLVKRLPASWRAIVARFWFLGVVAFAVVISVLFWKEMLATYARGEQTQDLRIPMPLIYGVYFLECLALAVIALREALTNTGAHSEIA